MTWALATGSSYRIAWSGEPSIRTGAWPSVVSTRAPIWRSGSATRSCGLEESDSSPVELEAALLPGEQAREEAHDRPCVAAVDRILGRAQAAEPRAVDADDVDFLVLDLDAERPHRRDRRLGVAGAAEAADDARALRDRAEQDGALGDALHAWHGDVAADLGSRLDFHSSTGAISTP